MNNPAQPQNQQQLETQLKQILSKNLEKVNQRILKTCTNHHIDPTTVKWIAISKYQNIEKIRILNQLGVTRFGENYLDELEQKAPQLPECHWVYTGQLQSRKIPKIMKYAQEIQSVCSFKHAEKISKLATTQFPIYIQVNIGHETTKAGVSWEEALDLAKKINKLDHLQLKGVMSIPPKSWDNVSYYQEAKKKALSIGEGFLSIGMSSDLEFAIIGGSDCLRLGTCLFGQRSTSM